MNKARIFRVARSALNSDQQLVYVQNNFGKIERLAKRPGPYIYRIDKDDVVKVFPPGA